MSRCDLVDKASQFDSGPPYTDPMPHSIMPSRFDTPMAKYALRIVAVTWVGALVACAPQGAAKTTPLSADNSMQAAATTPANTQSPSPSALTQPKIVKREVTETQKIPFKEKKVNDPTLSKGSSRVTTRGVAGVKKVTYEVTYADGVQTGKKLLRAVTTAALITQVTMIGTKEAAQCDPNYAGACVPIASDVDCAGGSGNGPAYVKGPVTVIGSDIYGLDRDGDGIGCE
jgi:hypothetical protein